MDYGRVEFDDDPVLWPQTKIFFPEDLIFIPPDGH